MKELIIHDTRFIYNEANLMFLPFIWVEDRANLGRRYWTLFNTDLFKKEWDMEPSKSYYTSFDGLFDFIREYSDYRHNTDNFGLVNRIWDDKGSALCKSQLTLLVLEAISKSFKFDDLKRYGMEIRIKDRKRGYDVQVTMGLSLIPIDLQPKYHAEQGIKPRWYVYPHKLSDCLKFKKKLVDHFYIIKIDKKEFFSEIARPNKYMSPYVKVVENGFIARKFLTEEKALDYCSKYSENFYPTGYEIVHVKLPTYI